MTMSLSSPADAQNSLTFEAAVRNTYAPSSVGEVTPLPGGQHFARLSPDGKQVLRYDFQTGKQDGVLFDVAQIEDCPFETVEGYVVSPDGCKMLLRTATRKGFRRSMTATYYIYIIGNSTVAPLSDGGPQECPVFSQDGNLVAFVREGNIFLIKLLFNNSESQVTKDGAPGQVLNGKPDWVYEEEFAATSGLCFSPDGQMICWIRWDESAVGTYSFPLYAGAAPEMPQYAEYPGIYNLKYPKAGTPNSRVSVLSYDIKSRVTRTIKLPLKDTDYVPRIRFTESADRLAMMVLDRNQTTLDLYVANPRSGECKLLLRDQAKYYINPDHLDAIRFYADGFTYLSEKDGYNQLYFYAPGGTLRKQLTSGEAEVQEFYGYNPENGNFYYRSTLPGDPLRTAVYAANLKSGKVSNLTPEPGTHRASFSSDCSYFIDTYSALNKVPASAIYNQKGKKLSDLPSRNEELARQAENLAGRPTCELFQFTISDGTVLNGWLMKPADFDPSRRYPLIMFQYSGPKTQQVADSWQIGFSGHPLGFDGWLTTQGFLVACVDPRGTGGRGADFSGATYMRLGVLESDDQVAAAQYLGALSYVDPGRIGIWGWSFGGTVAGMSIMHPSHVFKAAVSVAPVTDWRFYDTAYTERYMRTPEENAEGYDEASVLSRVNNLEGKYLLVHGLADDNVHYQNAAQLSEALVQAEKQFDMQVYTNRDHGIYGGATRAHLYRRIADFFKANL